MACLYAQFVFVFVFVYTVQINQGIIQQFLFAAVKAIGMDV